MTHVVVIGAGIAGLAAARRLAAASNAAAAPLTVTVLEQTDRVGGKLRAIDLAGVRVDVGAEAVLTRRPEALELARAVGLGDAVRAPGLLSSRVWLDGQLRPLPAGTLLGIPADLDAVRAAGVLSDAALARAAVEAGESHPPLTGDVTVGELVTGRLGREVVERLVDPLLGGVYAAAADQISLRAAIPPLARRLAESGGSLVAAARAVIDSGRPGAAAGSTLRPGPVFASFRGGVAALAAATAAGLDIRLRTTVRGIRTRPGGGFVLDTGAVPQSVPVEADAVVVAVPAGKAAPLLAGLAPAAAEQLRGIGATSVAVVSLAFAPETVTLPDSSGFLVPAAQRRAVKGVTFTARKWPEPDGSPLTLRASLGRAGEAAVLQRDDDELVALVRHELGVLAGIGADPTDTHVTRWGGGLPQYGVGHVERVARIRAAVAAVPGLAVCGAAYDGVGVPACIASAHAAADQVRAGLGGGGQWPGE